MSEDNMSETSHIEVTDSGVETMNKNDNISEQTALYGLLAEYAQQDRFFVLLNKLIKKNSTNAMMIPMNIRADDFYFTLSNMKKSHVNGGLIANEYQKEAVEILDTQEAIVTISGRCDFVRREGETLHGDFVAPSSIKNYLQTYDVKKIAIIGSGSLARALAVTLKEYELAFYSKYVELLLTLSEAVEIDVDINRIDNDMAVDLGMYDVVIDASKENSFDSVTNMAPLCIDLNSETNLSSLQIACTRFKNSKYVGYETLLDTFSTTLYNKYIK